ncbi:MAG: thioredoxin domain-containing protein [Vicinamibacterales bacterium]
MALQERSERGWRSIIDLVATLSIIGACLTFMGVLIASRVNGRTANPVPASVGVIEFSDFECPFCGRFARETLSSIVSSYVVSGKLLYAFRHFPIQSRHPAAFKAAEAAECSGVEGRFWEMHTALFTLPLGLDEPSLFKKATGLGLDGSRFKACMAGEMANKVQSNVDNARALGITGTPTFLFGFVEGGDRLRVVRRETGAIPAAAFARILDTILSSGSKRE